MPSHLAFSDESSHNVGRFRGLGLVTLETSYEQTVRRKLSELLESSGIQEVKWQKVRNARGRFGASKLFDYALDAARARKFRVDVLIWDTHDQRHAITGPDDRENLHRMYYHLFRNVMKYRWPDNAVWHLYPDENNAMDWDSVTKILGNASSRTEIVDDLFSNRTLKARLKRDFRIERIIPCSSAEEPLVQLADLFVGLGVYSRACFDVFNRWLLANGPNNTLFPLSESEDGLGKSDNERCRVLNEFEKALRKNKHSVSLRKSKGLRTRNPEERVNFWWYEPQHSKDKAPVRSARSG